VGVGVTLGVGVSAGVRVGGHGARERRIRVGCTAAERRKGKRVREDCERDMVRWRGAARGMDGGGW